MKKRGTTSLAVIEDFKMEEIQLAEQLYNSAGLDPVVDAGLHDYDRQIQVENKFINKMLGTRGSDIRGYGEAVAKRVALAVYSLLNKQYGGKVGDLRSYIMTLEEERDRANSRYDDLMGRAIGILGEEYKDLRSDSKVFMEKLTTVLGQDLKESKVDLEVFSQRLSDIDGLRTEIRKLEMEREQWAETEAKEKEQLKGKYEAQIAEAENQHKAETIYLHSRIDALDKEKELLADTLAKEKEQLRGKYEAQLTELKNQHRVEIRNLDGEKELLADTQAKEKEQIKEKYEAQIVELENQHKAEVRDLGKDKELVADTLTKEKEQLKEKYEAQIVELENQHKTEIKDMENGKEMLAYTLNKEKDQLKEKLETQIAEADNQHKAEIRNLDKEKESMVETQAKEKEQLKEKYEAQIADKESIIRGLESEKSSLTNDLRESKKEYTNLKAVMTALAKSMPDEEMGKRFGEELYTFVLQDSKVPDVVVEGVGKFIDFKKYLGVAVEKGVTASCKWIEMTLGTVP